MPSKKKAKPEEVTEEGALEIAEPEEDVKEEVIEVATSKKTKKEGEDQIEEDTKIEPEEEEEENLPSEPSDSKPPKVTSFSQLDAKKVPADEEPEEEQGEEEEEEEKPKEKVEETGEAVKKAKISSEEVKKWIKDVPPETLDEEKRGFRINLKLLLLIVGVAALSGIIVGGIIYFNSRVSKAPPVKEAIKAPTPTPEAPKEEEVAPEEEINLADYSVRVLNGSGIPGEAGSVKETLTDTGFEDVDTGNADSYDYEQTEVSLKEGTPEAVYTKIEEALGGTYDVTKSEAPLAEDSEYDVAVVVGTRK